MEKHKCKLCFRSFSNGRALGGHMRSHMMSLPIPPKLDAEDPPPPPPPPPTPAPAPAPAELSEEADSASSSSSSEEEAEDEKELYYGLRENPKRSIRLGDPEFSFPAGTVDVASSVILQDRESETESSKNPTRRRSKRTRRSASASSDHYWQYQHEHNQNNKIQVIQDSCVNYSKKIKSSESEPVSSVSDATTDEDIAFCLMMLSRDNWTREDEQQGGDDQGEDDEQEDHEDEEESSENESEELLKSSRNTRTRGKYKCDTCHKVFKSYQALGGHRASHKKIKICSPVIDEKINDQTQENAGTGVTTPQKKIHQCPVCFRVFSSGQALGGHKRSHVINTTSTTDSEVLPQVKTARTGDNPRVICTSSTTKKSLNKLGEISFIDLNLPAPDDDDQDDEISQIELSAVSDAEFVNPIR